MEGEKLIHLDLSCHYQLTHIYQHQQQQRKEFLSPQPWGWKENRRKERILVRLAFSRDLISSYQTIISGMQIDLHTFISIHWTMSFGSSILLSRQLAPEENIKDVFPPDRQQCAGSLINILCHRSAMNWRVLPCSTSSSSSSSFAPSLHSGVYKYRRTDTCRAVPLSRFEARRNFTSPVGKDETKTTQWENRID